MDSFLGAKKRAQRRRLCPEVHRDRGRQTPCTQHASGAGDMSLAGEGARGALPAHRPPWQARPAGQYVDLPRRWFASGACYSLMGSFAVRAPRVTYGGGVCP